MTQVKLTRGLVALVDDEDAPRIGAHKWYALKAKNHHYAVRETGKSEGKRFVYMARVIMNCQPPLQVDHIDGNTLDNRKSNLRICTSAENNWNCGARRRNKSGLKGVTTMGCGGKWRAEIQVSYKRIYLGRFNTPEAAGRAYDEAAMKYHGEFARLNFPT
jgi:hypothetical protein